MMSKSSLIITALDAGMISSYPVTVLPQEQGFSRQLMDMNFTSIPGIVTKRPGLVSVLSPTTGTIINSYEYRRTDTGTVAYIVAHGNVLQSWTGTNWADVKTTLTTNSKYDFQLVANQVAVVNANDVSFLWDGTSVTTPTQFPKAQYLTEFRLRLLAAGNPADPLKLYVSHPGDPTAWDPLDVRKRAFEVYISPNDGQRITGLIALDDMVIIGEERNLYAMIGTTTDNFAIFPVDRSIGIGSHWASKIIHNIAYFPDKFGNIYKLAPGSGPQKISLSVQDLIETLVNPDFISDAVAFVYNSDQYVISLPTGADGVGRLTLVYDTLHKRWQRWSFAVAQAMEVSGDVLGTTYFTQPNDNQFYRLTKNILQDFTTQAIKSVVDTVELHFNHPAQDKEIHELFVGFEVAEVDCWITIFCRINKGNWVKLAVLTVNGNIGEYKVYRVPVGVTARLIEFRFENSIINQDMRLMNLIINSTLKELV